MKNILALPVLLIFLISCAPAPVAEATIIASLEGAEGSVSVNGSPATEGKLLKTGDVVKTGLASSAKMVFYDSAVLRLDENTEITIKYTSSEEKVSVYQTSGQTWSRILHLSGVTEYDVETPTTIASVRGTGFKVKVTSDDTEVAVGEGEVEVSTKKDGKILKRQLVKRLERAMVRNNMLDSMEMSAMTEDSFMELNLGEDEAFIDMMVKRFAKKHPRVVKALKDAGYTSEDAHEWMRDLATGEITPEEMRATIKDAMQDLEKEGVVRDIETDTNALETEQAEQDIVEIEQTTVEQDVVGIEARDACADAADPDACYNERATLTNDATHCASIQEQRTKDSCLSTVAINMKDSTLCNDIVDNEKRVFCEQNAQTENRITGDVIVLPQ